LLDYLRGVAIIGIFLFHCLGASYGVREFGWNGLFRDFSVPGHFLLLYPVTLARLGVAIFFVISGFCIYLSFSRDGTNDFRIFFTRRFFRLYPPYLCVLLFFALVWPPTSRLILKSFSDFVPLLSHLLLVQNFDPTFFRSNPPLWTMAVEAQLYVLFPLLLVLVRKWSWPRTLWLLALIECALRAGAGIYFTSTGKPAPVFLKWLPFFFWFSWSLGAAIADAYSQNRAMPFQKSSCLLWAGAVIIASVVKPFSYFMFLFVSLLTGTVIAKVLSGSFSSFRLRIPRLLLEHVRTAGLWSYSIYLIHFPLIYYFSSIGRKVLPAPFCDPPWFFVICVLSWFLIMPIGGVFNKYVESLGIMLGRKFMEKRLQAH